MCGGDPVVHERARMASRSAYEMGGERVGMKINGQKDEEAGVCEPTGCAVR